MTPGIEISSVSDKTKEVITIYYKMSECVLLKDGGLCLLHVCDPKEPKSLDWVSSGRSYLLKVIGTHMTLFFPFVFF